MKLFFFKLKAQVKKGVPFADAEAVTNGTVVGWLAPVSPVRNCDILAVVVDTVTILMQETIAMINHNPPRVVILMFGLQSYLVLVVVLFFVVDFKSWS